MRRIVLAGALGLSACVSIGSKFDISKADQLKPGISTEADAKALFGAPVATDTVAATRHDILTWQYSYGTGIGTGGGENLKVEFDQDGKMIAIVHRAEVGIH